MTDFRTPRNDLRDRAKSSLKRRDPDPRNLSLEETRNAVEELLIHQTELEIQNDELLRVQAELTRTRDRYATLFNAAPVGYLRVDASGIILQVNQTLSDMVGISQDKLRNYPVAELFYEGDREIFLGRYRAFFKHPAGKCIQLRIKRKNGELFHARLEGRTESLVAHGDTASTPRELFLTVADICETVAEAEARNRANHALQRSRHEVTALLDAARAVIAHTDFETAAKHIFEKCKEVTGATSGYIALLSEQGDENEVLFLDAGGRPCSVDPELPMPIRGLRELAYRTRKPAYDNRFATSDWMRFMPKGHVTLDNVLFAPLLCDDKPVGLIGLANKAGDFTEEDAGLAGALGDIASVALMNSRNLDKLNENRQQLSESLDRTSSILESISDAFCSLDDKLNITYFNRTAEKLVSKKAETLLGCRLFDAFPLLCQTEFEANVRGALRDDMFRSFEMRAGTPSAPKWYEFRLYPQKKGLSIYTQDITGKKEAQLAKEHLEKKKQEAAKLEIVGQLAAGVAHEFNNLLSPILGHAEMIYDEVITEDMTRQSAGEILRAASRSRELVLQLLAFGRQQMLHIEKTSLADIVSTQVRREESSLPPHTTITLTLGSDTPIINGDKTHIQKAVSLLVKNAESVLPNGGTIQIRTDAEAIDASSPLPQGALSSGRFGIIEIRDDGETISPERLKRIFEPFYSEEQYLNHHGLELASVYGIVKQHGGDIVASSSEEDGNCFKVYLPAFL